MVWLPVESFAGNGCGAACYEIDGGLVQPSWAAVWASSARSFLGRDSAALTRSK
jgi:hypothetical protein